MRSVEVREGDIVGGVENHGENVLLANTHQDLCVAGLLRKDAGRKYLGRVDVRISRKIMEQPLEIGGMCAGDKGSAAPVVEQCAGQLCA